MTAAIDRLSAALAARYRVERELGQGGMATVYLAEDLKHRRKVAVKVLRQELAAIVGAERFLKEIEVTAGQQHPNILPLYDSGEADTLLYYVMPYVEGETLAERLKREKQLGVDETVRIAEGVAAALQFAHQHGVIHRDIKPANILLQSGRPVVADFGIALALTQAGGAERVHVRARVQGPVAGGLLGAHVVRSAERQAGLGQPGADLVPRRALDRVRLRRVGPRRGLRPRLSRRDPPETPGLDPGRSGATLGSRREGTLLSQ